MAGDIKRKDGTQGTLTFTTFNSLAGSSSFLGGASSAAVNNTSTLALDYLLSAEVTWSSTAPAAGTYRLDIHVYGSINETPTYPVDGSGNRLGTDTARTFASDGDKANGTVPVPPGIELAATASKVYTMRPASVAALFGGTLPQYWGVWATHGVTTSSSTPHSSGNTWTYLPVLGQYT